MTKRLIILVVIILLIATIPISIAYFGSSGSASGQIQLAELDFVVNYNGDISQQNLAKGDQISAVVSITNCRPNLSFDGLVGMYIRTYIETYINGEYYYTFEPVFASSGDWIHYRDKYYYKNEILPGQEVNILTGIILADFAPNEIQGNDCEVRFVVEGVQSSFDAYKYEWPEVPDIF